MYGRGRHLDGIEMKGGLDTLDGAHGRDVLVKGVSTSVGWDTWGRWLCDKMDTWERLTRGRGRHLGMVVI